MQLTVSVPMVRGILQTDKMGRSKRMTDPNPKEQSCVWIEIHGPDPVCQKWSSLQMSNGCADEQEASIAAKVPTF